MTGKEIVIRAATTQADFIIAKELILEYVNWLGMDLSFQNFDSEIGNLKEMYSAPTGGLLLAMVNGQAAGIAGIRKFESNDCELKRMFVKSDYRNLGIGKELLKAAIALAKSLNYNTIKLDTADFMVSAIRLYQANGFVEIPSYRYNPHESAKYFELVLS